MKKIIILLSTYNGEKYLREQLESLIGQDLCKDDQYMVELFVRDDGSKDHTVEMLSKYTDRIKLNVVQGTNVGAERSFWELVQMAPEADFYAFCDQDDVWDSNKLSRAVHMLEEKDQHIPLLYCSSFRWTDSELNEITVQRGNHKTSTELPYALLYSLSPGCTFVFNHAALLKARKYDFSKEHVEIHDWLLFKITAMLGEVIYDRTETLSYRQHGNNTIGNKNEGFRGMIERTRRFLTSNAGVRSKTAQSLLRTYAEELKTLPEQQYYVNLVANYKKDRKLKKAFLNEKDFIRDEQDYLRKILILTNKI